MDLIQAKLIELESNLMQHAVLIQGTKSTADYAKTRADHAVQTVTENKSDLIEYTDDRIQELRDELIGRLTALGENLIGSIGGITDGKIGSNNGLLNSDWNTITEEMRAEQRDILRLNSEFTLWIENTFDVELPALRAEIAAMVADTEAQAQGLLEEANTSRQETLEMAARWRRLADDIAIAKNKIIEMDYSRYEEREELYRNISVEFKDRFAEYSERINAAAGEIGSVVDKVETLEATQGGFVASIENLERVMVEGNEQLAQQIISMSVGTQTQFDPAKIWHFDSATEGWTGGTWNGGALQVLVPVTSPVISIDAGKYRQIRLRVTKVGVPAWVGTLDWEGAMPPGPMSLPEPEWKDGVGEITINPGWTGTLTRFTLVLTTAGNASNYYLVDWIAVGRPSPGPSSAQLDELRQTLLDETSASSERLTVLEARMEDPVLGETIATALDGLGSRVEQTEEGLLAEAEKITVLESKVNDPATGLTATSTAIDALTTRTSTAEDKIATQAGQIISLTSSLEGKAGAAALETLNTKVIEEAGKLSTISTKVTSLESSLSNIGSSTAFQGLSTRMSEAEGDIEAANAAITKLGTDLTTGLGTKASTSAVSALTTRVSAAEGTLSTQNASITALQTDVTVTLPDNITAASNAAAAAATAANGKGKVFFQTAAPTATADKVAQNLWIDTTGSANTPKRWNGTAWVAVSDKAATDALAKANEAYAGLATKASSAAFDTLSNAVNHTTTGLAATAKKVTDLRAEIIEPTTGLIAKSQAISALTSTVSTLEESVSAQAQSITGLQTTTGKYTASGLFRTKVETTPTGYVSRIALYAAGSNGEAATARVAGMYMLAKPTGSEIQFVADRLSLIQNDAGGGRMVPFFIKNGVTYMRTAVIEDLTMGRAKIADGAISGYHYALGNKAMTSSATAATVIASLSLKKGRAAPMPLWFSAVFPGRAALVLQRRIGTGAWTNLKNIGYTENISGITHTHVDTYTGMGSITYRVLAYTYASYTYTTGENGSSGRDMETHIAWRRFAQPVSQRFLGALNIHK